MEKATKAFVSHVRAYSKHECSLLLRIKEFPFGQVATTYGLLQLPKMPELKKYDSSGFSPVDIDLNEIPYKDKKREEIRQQKLEIYKSTGSWPGRKIKNIKKSSEPWALSKQKKIDKKEKRLKRKKVKELKRKISDDDLEELAQDVALMKKIKKRKVGEDELDKSFGLV